MYVCMYVCMYTDDVRRFFRTLKSNGPIMYIPLYVRIYFSLTKTLKFMYVCMYEVRQRTRLKYMYSICSTMYVNNSISLSFG